MYLSVNRQFKDIVVSGELVDKVRLAIKGQVPILIHFGLFNLP
jgi:hypothetical protein